MSETNGKPLNTRGQRAPEKTYTDGVDADTSACPRCESTDIKLFRLASECASFYCPDCDHRYNVKPEGQS